MIVEVRGVKSNCVPYRRKTLYIILTIPMIVLYIAIAYFFWNIGVVFFAIYAVLFILVAIGQSYACVYLKCPYVGKFAPCVGGFCLPASQIARLYNPEKRSERTYNIFVTMAFITFAGIIFFPIYFFHPKFHGFSFESPGKGKSFPVNF